jgi:hypothetical protein
MSRADPEPSLGEASGVRPATQGFVAVLEHRVPHLQGPLQGSKVPGFQGSKDAFFLTQLPAQEIETQQNRCWEIPAFTLGTASPLS